MEQDLYVSKPHFIIVLASQIKVSPFDVDFTHLHKIHRSKLMQWESYIGKRFIVRELLR